MIGFLSFIFERSSGSDMFIMSLLLSRISSSVSIERCLSIFLNLHSGWHVWEIKTHHRLHGLGSSPFRRLIKQVRLHQ